MSSETKYPPVEVVEARMVAVIQRLPHPSMYPAHCIPEIIRAAIDLYIEGQKGSVESPAEERIVWAAYPWANWAAKNKGERNRVIMFQDEPRLSIALGFWEDVAEQCNLCETEGHIPGHWTKSLRKRPEGV